MKTNDFENLKDGQYLCEVEGFKHTHFMVLKHTKEGWWRYIRQYTPEIEGWFGLDKDARVVRYMTLLQEE